MDNSLMRLAAGAKRLTVGFGEGKNTNNISSLDKF
ncbi:hypothetical protein BOSE62_150152 [Bosea sp. 62]|nr:hypothetical protein BOSE21B_10916 [Bosea sp. 21B]CAD5262419.1 hypothetical protein BOSE7B_150221 [Bosea sp. 7B]CAD5272234.1 hypothetical protein BOSE46_20147 [Bosea sp. 46]VVT43691.1 hypothetical protein BOS5A_10156 [Bosea sp. EC-HK365B]VXB21603.1 hypothetical protein BOSE29B_10684 [Bosea sp. 29B]VXB71032.1 hypothetical protein BOSE62_150152 [Bosea sp. 62]VXC34881.1 hypothetical protein BOSE127_180223 [Bosea sp. 127]VXC56141.1 hypothetical protein BOSE125_30147 [Bosea sp. 125]